LIEARIALSQRAPGLIECGIALGHRFAQGAQFRSVLLQFLQRCFARLLARRNALRQRLLGFPKLALLRLKRSPGGCQVRCKSRGPLRGRRLALPGFLEGARQCLEGGSARRNSLLDRAQVLCKNR
jgi:hypothetical protein